MDDSSKQFTCPIAHWADEMPDAPAFYEGDSRISYRDFDHRVRQFQSLLSDAGVIAGARIGVLANNSLAFVAAIFAVQRLKAVLVPLNVRLTEANWTRQLKAAEVTLLLSDEKHLTFAQSWNGKSRVLTEELTTLDQATSAIPPLEVDDLASILFTSGSTGTGKGVPLHVRNHFYSALGSNDNTRLAPGDVWLASLPMYHVGGLEILYRTSIAGAAARIMSSFDIATIRQTLEEYPATHLSLVPTMLEQLIDGGGWEEFLPKVKVIMLGGAPPSGPLLEKVIKDRLPVLTSFGMTETTSHITFMGKDDPIEKVLTAGRPLAHVELRILSDSYQELPAGEVGEIALAGPTIFKKYLDPKQHPKPEHGKWFLTGDLGVLDEDGYLSVVGRKDDMFISGGENIYSGEIENVARTYPRVRRCAVIPVEDRKWGKRPVLFVQTSSDDSFSKEHLRSFLLERLAKLKTPDVIIEIDDFPETGIGKTDYQALFAIYNQQSS
jgi:O-succinylbenzoic acid--CoA ligase